MVGKGLGLRLGLVRIVDLGLGLLLDGTVVGFAIADLRYSSPSL